MKTLATIAATMLAATTTFAQNAATTTPQQICQGVRTHAELDRRMTQRVIWSTEVLAYIDERKSPREHSPGTARIAKPALFGFSPLTTVATRPIP